MQGGWLCIQVCSLEVGYLGRTGRIPVANVLEDAVRQVYGPRRSVIVCGLKT
jgi:hypothetical protein